MTDMRQRRAIFLDRDGVINVEVDYLHRPEDLRLLPGVPEAIAAINGSSYLAVVITNQSVIARNLCTIAELGAIHGRLGEMLAERGAHLDAIYFCPHHPSPGGPSPNREYAVSCNCRKPAIGMIRQAERELGIDLSRSWMVGDTGRDAECGRNAGLRTALVRTGHPWAEGDTRPDHFFDTLPEAVRFILGQCSR